MMYLVYLAGVNWIQQWETSIPWTMFGPSSCVMMFPPAIGDWDVS
jgi:hypothetical protein